MFLVKDPPECKAHLMTNILEIRSPEIYTWSMHRHCTQCDSSGPQSREQNCYPGPAVLTNSWFALVSASK